jgi:hypothetical protein
MRQIGTHIASFNVIGVNGRLVASASKKVPQIGRLLHFV